MIHMQVPFDSGSGRVGVSAGLWVGCSLLNHVSIGMAKPHQNMHTLAASRPLRLQHQVFHSLHTECSAKSSGNLKPIRSLHWSLHSLSTNTSVIFNDIQCNSTIVLYILSFFMSKSVVQCVDLYYSSISESIRMFLKHVRLANVCYIYCIWWQFDYYTMTCESAALPSYRIWAYIPRENLGLVFS